MKTVTEFVDSLAPRSPLAFGALHKEVTARDAEHRAELAAAQATIEQLGKDGAAMATENERIKGELGEARSIVYDLVLYAQKAPGAARTCHRARVFLAAPPPAESTPVQATPPDDIRARLRDCETEVNKALVFDIAATKALQDFERRLAALDEFVHRLAQDSATQGAVVTLENKVAALEAKGEPGTVLCDEHGREDCGRPVHAKGAKP